MIRNLISRLRSSDREKRNQPQEAWSVTTAALGEESLVIRFRVNAAEELGKENFPTVIAIAWAFESLDPETHEAMNNLEDIITAEVEKQRVAYLTAIVTGAGSREWQYYSISYYSFMKVFNESLSCLPVFPINISYFSDSEWTAYLRLAGSEFSPG